jgi:hypothetical protein
MQQTYGHIQTPLILTLTADLQSFTRFSRSALLFTFEHSKIPYTNIHPTDFKLETMFYCRFVVIAWFAPLSSTDTAKLTGRRKGLDLIRHTPFYSSC